MSMMVVSLLTGSMVLVWDCDSSPDRFDRMYISSYENDIEGPSGLVPSPLTGAAGAITSTQQVGFLTSIRFLSLANHQSAAYAPCKKLCVSFYVKSHKVLKIFRAKSQTYGNKLRRSPSCPSVPGTRTTR